MTSHDLQDSIEATRGEDNARRFFDTQVRNGAAAAPLYLHVAEKAVHRAAHQMHSLQASDDIKINWEG